MYGAGMRLASQARKTVETATMPASHAQAGTRRQGLSTKLDLGEATGELRGLRRPRLDSDLGRGEADVAQHRVRDRLTAGGPLEGGNVELGRPLEVVLAPDEVERRRRHRRARAL